FRHQRFRDLVFGPAAEQARGRLPSSNRTRKRSTSEYFKPIRKLTRHGLKTLCFEATSTPSTRRLNAADSAPRGILIKPPKFGGGLVTVPRPIVKCPRAGRGSAGGLAAGPVHKQRPFLSGSRGLAVGCFDYVLVGS